MRHPFPAQPDRQLTPNTRVQWQAAAVGGLMAGSLWHLNNLVSVNFVSRVTQSNAIYGSLGMMPVFMVGLYLGWLILLFGAQVSYAFQNRAAYVAEHQDETVNQSGREFIALRVMTHLAQLFQRAEKPAGVSRLAKELGVPSRLVGQILQTLLQARLVVETLEKENGFSPARPLGTGTHPRRRTSGRERDPGADGDAGEARLKHRPVSPERTCVRRHSSLSSDTKPIQKTHRQLTAR